MAIREHGFEDSIRRVTVLQRLGRDFNSRSTRDLITNTHKYGLISGSYASEDLALTEAGKAVVGARNRQREFALAIDGVAPFKALYERLKDRRIPALDVLESQVTGVADANRRECASLFLQNARYIGLIYSPLGSDHIRSIEQTDEELGGEEEAPEEPQAVIVANPKGAEGSERSPNGHVTSQIGSPRVHMDINIHIDANSSPEVIDQVFASMARHIYNRE